MNKLKSLFWGEYFFIICPVFIILLVHVFSPPLYSVLKADCNTGNSNCPQLEKINRKDHLLESVQNKYPSDSHLAKTEFRLTVPFIAKLLNIDTKTKIYLLQVLAGLFFFIILNKLLYSFSFDKKISFLSSLGFGFIYIGYSFISEMMGHFDCFAFLFLLIAMLDINIFIIGIAVFLAFWTDERSILSSSLILFWWQYKQIVNTKKGFFNISKQSYCILISLLAYLLLRWYLIKYFGFKNQLDGTGLSIYKSTMRYSGLVLWQSFEGFWLFIVLALYYFYKKNIFVGSIFIFINLVLFIGALSVLDVTRSAAYMFPSIIVCIYIITQNYPKAKIAELCLIALFFCFIFPSYNIVANGVPTLNYPIYIRVLKHLIHFNFN